MAAAGLSLIVVFDAAPECAGLDGTLVTCVATTCSTACSTCAVPMTTSAVANGVSTCAIAWTTCAVPKTTALSSGTTVASGGVVVGEASSRRSDCDDVDARRTEERLMYFTAAL